MGRRMSAPAVMPACMVTAAAVMPTTTVMPAAAAVSATVTTATVTTAAAGKRPLRSTEHEGSQDDCKFGQSHTGLRSITSSK